MLVIPLYLHVADTSVASNFLNEKNCNAFLRQGLFHIIYQVQYKIWGCLDTWYNILFCVTTYTTVSFKNITLPHTLETCYLLTHLNICHRRKYTFQEKTALTTVYMLKFSYIFGWCKKKM